MQEAEQRLIVIVSLSLGLILVLLYMAFRSLLDALVVLSGVVAVSVGGIWALLLTGSNFNISAAVGFISILGVAIMNGLLMISSFNALRAAGVPLREAIVRGMEKLVRPVTMTALAAIIGLLPAAFSTQIGSESQKPLAIAVVGGMIATLVLTNLVPVLYSFYGHREPPAGAGQMAHIELIQQRVIRDPTTAESSDLLAVTRLAQPDAANSSRLVVADASSRSRRCCAAPSHPLAYTTKHSGPSYFGLLTRVLAAATSISSAGYGTGSGVKSATS
jgi:hypothetical protein